MRSSSIVIVEGKTKLQRFGLVGASVFAGVLLSGCLGEDEQLQQQLRDLRAEVKAAEGRATEAEEKMRELSSKVQEPAVSPTAPSADPAALKAANDRIAQLERELAAAKEAPPPGSAPVQTAESYKALAKQLQTDLMQKVSELSDQLQAQIPSADVQEVTVKRIRPPEEIATAFSSAITFTLLDASRRPVPLSFPVEAGLDGGWKIPTVEDVKRVYGEVARGIPQSAPAPNPVAGGAPAAAAPSAPSGAGTPAFVKQSDGSILVNWDGNTSAAPAPTTTAAAAPAPAPAPSPAVTPTPTPAAPQPAAAPTIPAPVMPVQQDIIVRFE